MFHTENARMLSVFYLNLLFLPCGRMLPQWWVVFRVVRGQLIYCWALYVHCAETLPSEKISARDRTHRVVKMHCGLSDKQAVDAIVRSHYVAPAPLP